jgi:uncharacterized membrane protein YebE (DUF533 family)
MGGLQMSLVGTLAKVAVGVAIAKGVGAVMQNARQSGGHAGTGASFGGAGSPRAAQAGAPGGLEDIMKSVLGGAPASAGQGAGGAGHLPGGLGGLLEQLSGGAATSDRGGAQAGGIGGLLEQLTGAGGGAGGAAGGAGGLGDLLGQLTGQGGKPGTAGGAAGAGGLGDLLGGLLGGAAAGGAAANGRSFGDILNQSLQNMGEPDVAPTAHQEAAAALMLRAMVQAAKADGTIDAAEKAKLTKNLQDATDAEMQFVKGLIAAPVDVEALVRDTPKGLEAQVYTMSVMAIDLDNQSEANYLHALAGGLGLSQQAVNGIHAQLGVPALYT